MHRSYYVWRENTLQAGASLCLSLSRKYAIVIFPEDSMTDAQDLADQALAQANSSAVPEDIGEALTSLQNIIERNAIELDRIKEELKLERESLSNILDNDDALSDAQSEAEVLTQKVKERKVQINASLEVAKINANVKELSERKKETEEALNNHLLNLYKITGTAIVDMSSGEQREFSIRASLKSAGAGKKKD